MEPNIEAGFEAAQTQFTLSWQTITTWLTSPQFYAQLSVAATAILVAFVLALMLRARVKIFAQPPEAPVMTDIRTAIYKSRTLLFPVLALILSGFARSAALQLVDQDWLIRIVQGLTVIALVYTFVENYIRSSFITTLFKWVGIPLAMLAVFGWLDEIVHYLDLVSLEVGNIKLSLFAITRTFLFGVILFWLGRISNTTGKKVIRNQPGLDVGTREVFVKLFEIGVYVLIFLLLLQVMGINLTALAVFGGALGVGLGFGLQQIASNFISGLIILLDRSITIDDYIQLEDGRGGRLRELNMRSATLETYDGKDIMVPNETFITTSFTNWTHYNNKQRYPLEFSVAYRTDLPKLFDIVRDVVASHPKVLSGDDVPVEERPDAEISSFGDSGINILVEFWMEGIDDGANRVGADLLLMIWTALQEHGIEIPFPQREVKLLGQES